jgi:hypothetical protein
MADGAFTELFPEWVLSYSLNIACGREPRFWTTTLVHLSDKLGAISRFSDLYPEVELPQLYFERIFLKSEAERFGIPRKEYERLFWDLRPDFFITADEPSTIIILEAKSGESIPPATWSKPKELRYFEFLQKAERYTYKGFYYIVPRKYEKECNECLINRFLGSPSLRTGVIFWEDLLTIIHDSLLQTGIDRILQETRGLHNLREWQVKYSHK